MVEFFRMSDGEFVPTEVAISRWSPNQLHGVAVCGLLAVEAEKHAPGAGFVPARFTVDLFQQVTTDPISLHSEVVRAGNRIKVADVRLVQQGQARARATVTFLAATDDPPGTVWEPELELPVPEWRIDEPGGAAPLFKSGAGEWLTDFRTTRDAQRKVTWHNLPTLVAGLPFSPFQRAAATGDLTNLVCHWGSHGVGYINADMTLSLSRLPEGPELGLQALDHTSHAGVAVSSAVLYDRRGKLGTATITAISNDRRRSPSAAVSEPVAVAAE